MELYVDKGTTIQLGL